jgi:glyoxylase-like metal-dependent hydrolase (beta-lactamase superfamily II)
MSLPDCVHDLELLADLDGRETAIHPAAIETERGLLLLDAGLPDTVDQLATRLDGAGFGLGDVDAVAITHQDPDHAGGLSRVVERSGALVIAHERAAPVVDGRENPRIAPGGDRYPPARVDLELGDRATFHTKAGPARVVATPGHTPGHVSVYLPDARFLVAGDALTAEGGTLNGPDPEATEEQERAADSVSRLAELDVDRTLCYHGGLADAGAGRIAEIAQR